MSREFQTSKPDMVHYQSRHDDMLIVVFDGEQYLNQMNREPLDTFDAADFVEVGRIRHHDCEFGNYPWDHWKTWALEDGVPEDLADLGRSLVREADQHSWAWELQIECGWQDNGAALIAFALRDPLAARKRWEHLMETDGERV